MQEADKGPGGQRVVGRDEQHPERKRPGHATEALAVGQPAAGNDVPLAVGVLERPGRVAEVRRVMLGPARQRRRTPRGEVLVEGDAAAEPAAARQEQVDAARGDRYRAGVAALASDLQRVGPLPVDERRSATAHEVVPAPRAPEPPVPNAVEEDHTGGVGALRRRQLLWEDVVGRIQPRVRRHNAARLAARGAGAGVVRGLLRGGGRREHEDSEGAQHRDAAGA
eukprot:SAG22_NODE_1379_length_4547_cov_8.497752_4_plen_224_part_00